MSKKETTTIKVSVLPNHPNGQRIRAWITFTEEPKTFEVTAEQLEAIKNDPALKIYGKVAEVEPQEPAKATEAPQTIVDPDANKTPEADPAATVESAKTAEATNTTPVESKPISRMNKEELVAGLEAKGLKADVDFDPDANNKDLAELLAAQA